MKEIGVGILGFGTVGAGVADGLLRNRRLMAERLGVVLSEPGLTPIQEARLEEFRSSLPKRARARRATAAADRPGVRRWGDGVPVGAAGKGVER